MSDTKVVHSGGIGLGGLTFLVFLVLKLTGFIDWSWWWVTAPLWIPLALFAAIAAAVFSGAFLIAFVGTLLARRKLRKLSGRRRGAWEFKT